MHLSLDQFLELEHYLARIFGGGHRTSGLKQFFYRNFQISVQDPNCQLLLSAQALSLLDLLYDSLGFEVHCECLGRKEIWTSTFSS